MPNDIVQKVKIIRAKLVIFGIIRKWSIIVLYNEWSIRRKNKW